MLVPRKIERPRLKDLNSNTFEFNSNGFELGLDKRKVQNVRIFDGAPENGKRIIGKVRESKLEEEKAKGFNMQGGSWVIPKQWNILL